MCALVYFTLPFTHTQHKSRLCTHTYAPARARALSPSHTQESVASSVVKTAMDIEAQMLMVLSHTGFFGVVLFHHLFHIQMCIYTHTSAREHTHA